MTDLLMLHVSSNQLESLPNSCVECTWLEQLYANSNKLKTIPTGMADALIMLKRLTLSHNDIQELPKDFVERFGEPKAECDGDPTCVVTLASNPVLEKQQVTTTASNDNEDSNTSTPMEE
jgi:Leucine-rich repeat (LRR) protein